MACIHIGWARITNLEWNVKYIFISGINKPDKVHSWFKVYRNV